MLLLCPARPPWHFTEHILPQLRYPYLTVVVEIRFSAQSVEYCARERSVATELQGVIGAPGCRYHMRSGAPPQIREQLRGELKAVVQTHLPDHPDLRLAL